MSEATCKTCPWWFSTASGCETIKPGQCRRNPPTAQYIAVNHSTNYERVSRWERKTFWPFANHAHWCGEHPDRKAERGT